MDIQDKIRRKQWIDSTCEEILNKVAGGILYRERVNLLDKNEVIVAAFFLGTQYPCYCWKEIEDE